MNIVWWQNDTYIYRVTNIIYALTYWSIVTDTIHCLKWSIGTSTVWYSFDWTTKARSTVLVITCCWTWTVGCLLPTLSSGTAFWYIDITLLATARGSCYFIPYHSKQVCTLGQWFLNLPPNKAWAVKLAAQAWFPRRFKSHWPLARVVDTHLNQTDEVETIMAITNRMVELARKLGMDGVKLCISVYRWVAISSVQVKMAIT